VLIESLFSAMDFMSSHPTEVSLGGPGVSVPPRRVMPLTLILAEWLTNSCKYGAHSQANGRLSVEWDLPADSHRVRLTWTERGGPAPPDTVVPSLGTDLVQAFATRELDGVCRMSFPPEGARHELEFSTLE
jgi:two-component sensor histidine kinase